MNEGTFEEFNAAVGRDIKAIRQARGKSLRSLAEETGIALPTLIALEKGEGKEGSRLRTLFLVARALGTSVSAFLGSQCGEEENGGRIAAQMILANNRRLLATLEEEMQKTLAAATERLAKEENTWHRLLLGRDVKLLDWGQTRIEAEVLQGGTQDGQKRKRRRVDLPKG